MPVHAKAILPLRAQRGTDDAYMYYTRGACVKANSKRNFSDHLYHARECRRFQQVTPCDIPSRGRRCSKTSGVTPLVKMSDKFSSSLNICNYFSNIYRIFPGIAGSPRYLPEARVFCNNSRTIKNISEILQKMDGAILAQD